MAIFVKADGVQSSVFPPNGVYFEGDELAEYVGGYFEIIPVPGFMFIVNEEGRLRGLPRNQSATELLDGLLAILPGRLPLGPNDFLVGDVLICDLSEVQ